MAGVIATRASAAGYSRQDKATTAATEPVQPTQLWPILGATKPSQTASLRQAHRQERNAYLADHHPKSATYSSAEMNAYASAIPSAVPSTVVHIGSPDGRFDWGDAGFGAAGGIALSLLALGGMRGASRYRSRQTAALSD